MDNLNLEKAVGCAKISQRVPVGCDKISQRVLRLSSPVLADPLTKLISHFTKTSSCSMVWITRVIMPVFKKGNDTDKICYQPVSVLTTLSKVYERVLFDQMYEEFGTKLLSCLSGY